MHFLFLYSTTAVCVHIHFWQKIKSKQKNYFLLLFHSTTAAVRTQGWDGRTDRQTDGRTINRAWIPVENYWEIRSCVSSTAVVVVVVVVVVVGSS